MVYLDNLLALYQGVRQIGAFGAAVWCNCAPLAPSGHAAPELYSALQKLPLGGARPPFVRCVLWGKTAPPHAKTQPRQTNLRYQATFFEDKKQPQ